MKIYDEIIFGIWFEDSVCLPCEGRMEAPFDATKSKTNLLNFSGSAADMMAAMANAGIVATEAQEV